MRSQNIIPRCVCARACESDERYEVAACVSLRVQMTIGLLFLDRLMGGFVGVVTAGVLPREFDATTTSSDAHE